MTVRTTQTTDDALTRLEASMAEDIEAMRQGPYFYTWTCINEEDRAKQTWPSAEIRLLDETCVDDADGAWAGVYTNEATFEIRVRVALEQETPSSYYAIDERMNRALSDLKKCFGVNYAQTPCGIIMYKGMRRESEGSADSLMPKHMITTWLVRYTQSRTDPLDGGDA